ncbi:hypothetical protein B9Z55_006501 [Caenorhabditis nigoni]|uniref:C2H2-type domain-containing protein n=3 Tax=Caenorhabditis nigoni TaxID=1611254 RepID=A0A2G5V5J2_9PELO|nr:hypothetical protein B9Z55_006501 [Caenorhabditis nigoni]
MATIIGGGPRKPPRIMRRNVMFKHVKKDLRDDEGEKLKREGFQVKSGVLTVNYNHPSMFKPKILPGLANDVESYPCRFCEDKLFLTSIGLEKHGREFHPQNMDDIQDDINTISGEWKKREFERARSRDHRTMDRLRHEARAHQQMKAALGRDGPPPVTGEQYEACVICNMLVNIAHPTAMESHQRAHKKNDELRLQLIDQYGGEAVQRLTCDSCSLVFPDSDKLKAHVASHHARRKKYICKFCGHISQSMSELNLHKSDVHNYSPWAQLPDYLKYRRTFYQYDEEQKRVRPRTEMNDEPPVRQPILGEISEGDMAGRVTCPDCGLKLERPRLLFKHMERVHSKVSFCCMGETGGLPTFEIEVSNGEVFWTCCDTKFNNRPDFIEHRRLHIPTQHEEVIIENSIDPNMPSTSQSMIQEDSHEDGDAQDFDHDPNYDGMAMVLPGEYDFEDMVYIQHGRKFQYIHIQNPDGTIDPQHVVRHYIDGHDDQEDEGPILVEDGDMIIGEVDETGVEVNGYGHFQMDLGGEWSDMDNMQMMLVNEDEVIGEERVEDLDNHHIDHHQLIENAEEVEEEVVEINGQPLFD